MENNITEQDKEDYSKDWMLELEEYHKNICHGHYDDATGCGVSPSFNKCPNCKALFCDRCYADITKDYPYIYCDKCKYHVA